MVLINFKILDGTEENCDVISYSRMMFLIPAHFSSHLHSPNINIIMLSKVAEYLSNVCAREVVDRGGTVVCLSFLSCFHSFFLSSTSPSSSSPSPPPPSPPPVFNLEP